MADNILGNKKDQPAGNDLPDLIDSIDWNEVWRYRMTEWFSTLNGSEGDPFRHRGETQESLPVNARRKVKELVKARIAEIGARPGDSVLVIGRGSNLFAVPLATMGCRVTLVEPSPAMKTSPPDAATIPIELIEKRWEEVSLDELQEKYDVVVASHALWMIDIGPSIGKMDAVAGSVHLFWYLTPPVWAQVMGEIWKKVHGREFRFAPTAECLYQVLLQKDIFASISIEVVGSNQFYANIGEAVETFRTCTHFTEACQDNAVRSFLRTRLTLADSGFTLRGRSYDAKIWWRHTDQRR